MTLLKYGSMCLHSFLVSCLPTKGQRSDVILQRSITRGCTHFVLLPLAHNTLGKASNSVEIVFGIERLPQSTAPVHVLNHPRDAQKEREGNTTQQKGKATQHNLPKAVIFQRKKLAWVAHTWYMCRESPLKFSPGVLALPGPCRHTETHSRYGWQTSCRMTGALH